MVDAGVDVDGVLVRQEEPVLALQRGPGWLLIVNDSGALQPDRDLPYEVTAAVATLGPARQVLLGHRATADRPQESVVALGQALSRLRRENVLDPAAAVAVRTSAAGAAAGPGTGSWATRLERLLPLWGALAAAPGTVLPEGCESVTNAGGHRHLVTGPSASGKSRWAELCVLAEPHVTYLATGPVPEDADHEWAARVAAHRRRRPRWWSTQERAQVADALAPDGGNAALLWDSVGSWLTGVMDRHGAWEGSPGWREAVDGEVDAVVAAWRHAGAQVVAVSEEVGWGVVPPTRAGRLFADLLGGLNQRLGEVSESVTLVVAGRPVALA